MPVGPKGRTKRSYSMASLMRDDNLIHLIFDHVPEGVGSGYLSSLGVGDSVDILNCMGNFVLAPTSLPILLFVARYTGIVPIFAMLQQLAEERYAGRVHLIYASPTRSEEILISDMHELGLADLIIHRMYLDECEDERPEETYAAQLYPTLNSEECQVYLCGIGEMVRPLRKRFTTLECPRRQIKSERYN